MKRPRAKDRRKAREQKRNRWPSYLSLSLRRASSSTFIGAQAVKSTTDLLGRALNESLNWVSLMRLSNARITASIIQHQRSFQ